VLGSCCRAGILQPCYCGGARCMVRQCRAAAELAVVGSCSRVTAAVRGAWCGSAELLLSLPWWDPAAVLLRRCAVVKRCGGAALRRAELLPSWDPAAVLLRRCAVRGAAVPSCCCAGMLLPCYCDGAARRAATVLGSCYCAVLSCCRSDVARRHESSFGPTGGAA